MLRLIALTTLLGLALATPAGAIYHGTPEPAAATPWLVSLTADGPFCGGALIAPDRVLTAAHCVQGQNPAHAHVRIGGGNVGRTRLVRWRGAFFPTNYREIRSAAVPDDPYASATVNDVAIVILAAPVSGVPPLPLAESPPAVGEATLTVGRGLSAPAGTTTRAAYAARQHVLSSDACAGVFGTRLLHRALHLCTRDVTANHAQACPGDSGSPVLVRRDGALQQAGVVTWGGETQGHACGRGPADVAERVLPHLEQLTGPPPAFAPYAKRQVRVRRDGRARRCVTGSWSPAGADLTVRWFRQGAPRTRLDPDTGARVYVAGPRTYLHGHGRTLGASAPVSCEVTARTAGGWAVEDSSNRL